MIDAHCHITMYPEEKQPDLLAELAAAGFEALMMAGYDPSDWARQKELVQSQQSPTLLPVFGLHPWHVRTLDEQSFQSQLKTLAELLDEAVACGELGLDYYVDTDETARKQQLQRCEILLDLACQLQIPIVIHCVRAHHDMIRLLKERKSRLSGGMVHSFVGSLQIAQSYWDLGFCLSYSPFTLRAARDQLYQQTPAERLLIETDAPQAIRPKDDWTYENMTRPDLLFEVAEQVAKARTMSVSELFALNRRNLLEHFPRCQSLLEK